MKLFHHVRAQQQIIFLYTSSLPFHLPRNQATEDAPGFTNSLEKQEVFQSSLHSSAVGLLLRNSTHVEGFRVCMKQLPYRLHFMAKRVYILFDACSTVESHFYVVKNKGENIAKLLRRCGHWTFPRRI